MSVSACVGMPEGYESSTRSLSVEMPLLLLLNTPACSGSPPLFLSFALSLFRSAKHDAGLS